MSPGANRLLWSWMLIMTLFCPGIYHALKQRNCPNLVADDHINFWYDSLNDCYKNQMPTTMICTYVEAINDDDIE
jgi:hypothetical protein